MQNLQGKGPTGHQPASASHLSTSATSTTTSSQTSASRPSKSQATPALPIPRPSYHATQLDAGLLPPRTGDTPPRPINARQSLKRPPEAQETSADGKGDKKAKAAISGKGNGIKQERDSDAPPQAEPTPHVPEPMVDGVDALLTFGLRTNPSPLPPPGPLSSALSSTLSPALSRPVSTARPSSPPILEPDPLARPTESKSSSESTAAPAKIPLREALRNARHAPSLAELSGQARTKALEERRTVFEAAARTLKSEERVPAFRNAGQHLVLSCHATSEQNAAVDLLMFEMQGLVKHMTPQQRQEALRVAQDPLGSSESVTHTDQIRRRMQLVSLYQPLDQAAREAELAAARRAADLFDMDEDLLNETLHMRAEQFAAHAFLMSPEQRRAEMVRLREPGRLVHMEGEALRRALRLQAAQYWGLMRYIVGDELQAERAAALHMPQALQEMGDAAWQRTLDLRASELDQNCRQTPADGRLPALRQALAATPLATLRGPALERALALRKLLVRHLFQTLPPEGRDQALAEARTPATLADFSGQALDIAIRLRKLVFEEYFRTVPPSDGAAVTARVELASALDTTELASQPEALVARAALLRLALVGVAHQHTRPVVTPQALPSSTSSLSSSHTTFAGISPSVVHTATGSIYLGHIAPSSSSSRYVMNLASLPSSRYTMTTGSLLKR